jgi:hypothetical protein
MVFMIRFNKATFHGGSCPAHQKYLAGLLYLSLHQQIRYVARKTDDAGRLA